MDKMDRKEIVEDLIEQDIENIREEDEVYLTQLFMEGFKGYRNYTDDELIEEYNERIF